MRPRLCFFGLVTMLCIVQSSAFTMDSALAVSAKRAIGDMIDCRYHDALCSADALVRNQPEEPMGHILRLFTLGLQILDYGTFSDSVDFFKAFTTASQVVSTYETRNGRSSYSCMMAGFTRASTAAFYLNQKKYFSALGTGLDAVKQLQIAKNLDSSNVDVDFFLGMYDYAKAELRQKLWMVLFWYPGDKREGRRRLEACGRNALFCNDAAWLSLVDIYIQESEWTKAASLMDNLDRRFPGSRFVWWSRAKYFSQRKQYLQAAEVYDRLACSYESDPLGRYNALQSRLHQMESLCSAGQRPQAQSVGKTALQACDDLSLRRYNDTVKKIREIIEKG